MKKAFRNGTAALMLFILFGSNPSSGQLVVGPSPKDAEKTGQKIDAATAEQVLPYGLMSQDAYYDTTRINVPGWTRVPGDWEGIFEKRIELRDLIGNAKSVGFYAAVYKNNTTGEITIAYRGSVPLTVPNSAKTAKDIYNDWGRTNVPAAVGVVPDQYNYAVITALAARLVYPAAPSISVTGHSKGGGEATYAAQQTTGIAQVITFDPSSPGIVSSTTRAGTKQINVVVPGDTVGDPKDAVFGLSNLPGKTYTINSTTAYQRNPLYQTGPLAQSPRPPWSRNELYYNALTGTHDMGGVIGGLCSITLSSSCLSLQPAPGGQQPQPGATVSKPAPNLPAAVSPPPSQAPATIAAAPPPPPIPAPPVTWKAPSTTFAPSSSLSAIPPNSHPAPGGISLSKAAAARMPLNITLDGAYYKDGMVVLSGRYDPRHSLDAALLLTAVRLACENDDPYFSLDPLNGAAWLNEGKNASAALWERIKDNFKSRPAANTTRDTKPVLEFRTVSARRDYPALWASLAPSYPNLKSKLVFKPEWLRETRFGEVLYKGDVLLKELSYGVPILQEGELRAGKIERYVTAGYRDAAKGLLAQLEGAAPTEPGWHGSRLWFDLTSERVSPPPTPENPFPDLVQPYKLLEPLPTFKPAPIAVAPLPYGVYTPRPRRTPKGTRYGRNSRSLAEIEAKRESKGGSAELRELLRARNLIENISAQPVPVVAVKKDGNTLDLSEVYPHMFIRRHDQATGQDIPGNDPSLDDLALDVNQRIDRYVNAYTELGVLADLFRAYVVAVQMMKDARPLCARIQATPLLDAEKAVVPLPKEHPSELFITVGSYEFTDGNFRRLSSITGQSINGGVSISGRSLYATALKFEPTLITQLMDQVLSQRTDQAEWDVNDRRFIAFNIESDLPVAEKQFYGSYGIESNSNDGVTVILSGLTLLGFLCWYVAEKSRNARVVKAQKVRNIATNAYRSDNNDHYNGPRTMPDLLARPLSDSKKEKNSSDSVPAIHAVEAKFANATYYVNDVTTTARGYDVTGLVVRSDALWVKERQPTSGAPTQQSTGPSLDQKKSTTYPDRENSAGSVKTEFKNLFFNRTNKARITRDIESEFNKVFADETDEYREQLIAQRRKLSGCSRHEAMRRAIVELPKRLW